ncbi:Ff.00g133380.m01.CDS01 [Fusarium sp. VM40]|nr:Ff.00g133380.m01.CDS01 [Fusarium sp. VM40]
MASDQHQFRAAQKADFTDLYNQHNPRSYFTTLQPLEYRIPQQVLPLIRYLHHLSCQGVTSSAILDVGCSYGINGALLRHHIDMDTWTAHYTCSELSSEEQVLADKEFFASRTQPSKPPVLGFDKADHAVRYALNVGLIDAGWAEDLENGDPSSDLCRALQDVTLVICTGAVGYLTSRTFDRIMAAIDRPIKPWVLSTVIRTSSYNKIGTVLREHGLVTEKLPGVVLRQRRFASAQEQSDAIAHVAALGLNPTAENKGYLCADVYISRPLAETSSPPISQLAEHLGGVQVVEADVCN